jgi:hypothetical protein
MKFTIVFPSHESSDLSIAAVFIPCLVWMEGKHQLLNPHPKNPHYQKGDLNALFMDTAIKQQIADHTNKVTVVAHSTGHGTQEYLDLLLQDLRDEGFDPSLIHQ